MRHRKIRGMSLACGIVARTRSRPCGPGYGIDGASRRDGSSFSNAGPTPVNMARPLISNVSDTARWIASHRADESARPDALFHDPLAARLGGARGRAIAALVPRSSRNGWPWVTRTKLIDDLVMSSVAAGCDRVVNLAAGFDTRPYRLPLPRSLHWIEADLPALVEEKEQLLAGEEPACRLSRERVDLADPTLRSAFLDRAVCDATRALVLTEGLLMYLDDEVVRSLGRDLGARSAIRWWILDMFSPAVARIMKSAMGSQLAAAPMKFAPPDGVAFFESLGWKPSQIHPMLREAARLRRLPFLLRPVALLPDPNPRRLGKSRWSAVIRLER
jgi:methyltransferase (TIGR00027 family)